jgi:2-dehydro-3-deoxyphosphogalactonate aldolase
MDREDLLNSNPVIAIIRGVKPDEAVAVAEAMYSAGIRVIEVPLNSPEPFRSIKLIAEAYKGRMLVGAGTVLTIEDVQQVFDAGGEIIVSPNANQAVIEKTKELGMLSFPGIMTVSEAFTAVESGADGLKLFPADVVGSSFIKAVKVVLPAGTKVFAVGGVNATNMKDWLAAGADGFGLGSSIYKPGMAVEEIETKCREVMASLA